MCKSTQSIRYCTAECIQIGKSKDLILLFKSTALSCCFKAVMGSYETEIYILKIKFSGKRLEANNNSNNHQYL